MRRRRALMASAGLLGMALAAPAQTSPPARPVVMVEQLEQLALQKNPTLVQARTEIDAAKGRARQGGSLPNPQIGYAFEERPLRSGPDSGKQGFFIDQAFPFGKLGSTRRVYEREVDVARANYDMQTRRVLASVDDLYFQAVAAASRVEVRQKLAELTEQAVSISHQLYNTGAADQVDVLESEVENERAKIDLVGSRNAETRVWRRLGSVVGDPEMTPAPLPPAGASLPELKREEELQRLLKDSPEVAAARARVLRQEASLSRARRENIPSLFLRGGLLNNSEKREGSSRRIGWEGFAEAGLSINIFNQNQGNISAATAQLERARAETTRLELSLRARFSSGFDDYLTALRAADAYRTEVLPRAQRAYELYLARFREMAAPYPQVLIAQRTLFQSTEQYVANVEAAMRSASRIRSLLLSDGLSSPPRAGEMPMEMPGLEAMPGESPGAVRSGESADAVRPTMSRQE